ncbi:terminase small subunit [Bifidobacterium margollesii]|uniref:Terminase small subunit n=1 Tax=Bifidobacterium margollesii TaxID=2020964 RepID=A0A2N5J9J0_9BIFI|nr:hypothetical protein [Bifidobacterium margollesii]PLS30868.1 terminase small subunit [Bifidobacterium margollesii]
MDEYLTLLHRTLKRLEQAVFDLDTPPRDLAALSRRLLEVSRAIERLEGKDGASGPSVAVEVEDAEFDEEAV